MLKGWRIFSTTSAGYAALCIDTWAFGERRGRSEGHIFKHMLWHGQVMWGMMVYDNLRALDYLVAREDVDETRTATLGISMGSTMAWWTAALDESDVPKSRRLHRPMQFG